MSNTADNNTRTAAKVEAPAKSESLTKQLAENNSPVPQAQPKPAAKKAASQAQSSTQKPASKSTKSTSKTAIKKPSTPRKVTGTKKMATAKQDTANQAFETVTAASNEAVKEGFEKSLSAMNEFSAFQKDSVDALIASATATSKSLEEINASTVAFTKKSMEDSVAAAKSVSGAKSVQEIFEIQTGFAKASFEAYVGEINKNSELLSTLVKDGFKPLNDRVAAAVEVIQSQR